MADIETNLTEEEAQKAGYIDAYIKSLAAIEDAMEPFKDQKRDLRKEYDDQGWLSKDEQRVAVRAWRMVQKDDCIEELTDYYDQIRRYLRKGTNLV